MLYLSDFKNLIFDLGSVLVGLDRAACIREFEKVGIMGVDRMIGLCSQNGVFGRLELGTISTADFCDEVAAMSSYGASSADVCRAWNAIIVDTPRDLLEQLLCYHQSHRTFMLSNVNDIHIRHTAEVNFSQIEGKQLADYFERLFLSHEMHLRKPMPEIYSRLIAEAEIDPKDTIFFDDNVENLAAARCFGIRTVQVTSPMMMAEILGRGSAEDVV